VRGAKNCRHLRRARIPLSHVLMPLLPRDTGNVAGTRAARDLRYTGATGRAFL